MATDFDPLAIYWLAYSCLGLAFVLGLLVVGLRCRLGEVRLPLIVLAMGLTAPALGAILLPFPLAEMFFWAGVILFGGLILGLLLAAFWQRHLAIAAVVLSLFGAGGLWMDAWQLAAHDIALSLRSVEFVHPWWLLLLCIVPAFVALASRSLYFPNLTDDDRRLFWRVVLPSLLVPPVGLFLLGWYGVRCWSRLRVESYRPWVSLGLRCLLILFLALALSEPLVRQTNDQITVLFLVDRSESFPEKLIDDPNNPGERIDERLRRIRTFIDDSVTERGASHTRDRAGMIVFGRYPLLELPPSDAPRFNLREVPLARRPDRTNIAAAIQLAMASFPQDTAKRIVLISDGNENMGDLSEAAREAKALGVQIDVLPLAVGEPKINEVLLEDLVVPPLTEQGSKVPIRVMVRSNYPDTIIAKVTLKQLTERVRNITFLLPQDRNLGWRLETPGDDQGAVVGKLEPNSPLLDVGVEESNEIVRIDGILVTSVGQVIRLLGAKEPGERITMQLRRDADKIVGEKRVALRPGLNPAVRFPRPLANEQRSYTFEAEVQPIQVLDKEGRVVFRDRLPGDRPRNNRMTAHVIARGRRRVLILENRPLDKPDEVIHTFLVDKLRAAGDDKFQVDARSVSVLNDYPDAAKLAVFLSDYDCVILANVPAERVTEEQREVLRTNTHDQGCGLVMVGGKESFGAGGWQNTSIEKALPVDADIRSLKVQAKSGLVMVMHACEMADGNAWQRKIGKLAVERLGPADEVGIIDYGFQNKWVVPMQPAGPNRRRILAKIDGMTAGDMLDFETAFQMAYKELTNPKRNLATKHVIVISDGDPGYQRATLAKFARAKITVTTVGIATHGPNEDQKMKIIAKMTGGRAYSVKDASQLPAIYIKESRLVSQSFVHEKKFLPQLLFKSGPTERLPDPLPPLRGYVRTTPKNSPLVVIPIETPEFNEQEFPLLAYWHYGLGKSVAFTSDAGNPSFWSREWVDEGMYAKFWEQVVEWSLRPTESNRLTMLTEWRNGKIRIRVEGRDELGKLDPNLKLRGAVSLPGTSDDATGTKQLLRFVQKNTGLYEAEVKAEESGSYFVTAQATRKTKIKDKDGIEREVEEGIDSVRGAVTVLSGAESFDLESNPRKLEKAAELTGGRVYDEYDLSTAVEERAVYRTGLPTLKSQQPLWFWLLFLTGILLFFDIAIRRIALNADEIKQSLGNLWLRLRGEPIPEPDANAYFERLESRKTQVEETATQRRSRRFEAPERRETSLGVDLNAPTSGPPTRPPKPSSAPPTPTPQEAPAEDYAERLARAKREAMERKRKKDE